LYWWKVSVRVERLDPPANFTATWICLCSSCNAIYSLSPARAGDVRTDNLVAQDFLLGVDIFLEG
jgi:hypothetical protein